MTFIASMGLAMILAAIFTTVLELTDFWRNLWLAICISFALLFFVGVLLFGSQLERPRHEMIFPVGAPLYFYDDLFVTKFGADGSIVYSTYVGGNCWDRSSGIALNSDGSVWVSGYTDSTIFPQVGAIDTPPTFRLSKSVLSEAFGGWLAVIVFDVSGRGRIVGCLGGFARRPLCERIHAGCSWRGPEDRTLIPYRYADARSRRCCSSAPGVRGRAQTRRLGSRPLALVRCALARSA